jgi:hypothetical protein
MRTAQVIFLMAGSTFSINDSYPFAESFLLPELAGISKKGLTRDAPFRYMRDLRFPALGNRTKDTQFPRFGKAAGSYDPLETL